MIHGSHFSLKREGGSNAKLVKKKNNFSKYFPWLTVFWTFLIDCSFFIESKNRWGRTFGRSSDGQTAGEFYSLF